MTGMRPWRMESDTVSPTASMAPVKAKAGSEKTLTAETPSAMASTAPTEAPLDTPMMPGSASGLLKMPCRTAPEMPSPAPTMRPTSVRGRRMCQSTACCSGVTTTSEKNGSPAAWENAASTHFIEMSYCPELIERTTAKSTRHGKSSQKKNVLFPRNFFKMPPPSPR